MYATSKLIIPPKPARNSPYIPKLRIKLRPNSSRNRSIRPSNNENVSDKFSLRNTRRRQSFVLSDLPDALTDNRLTPTSSGNLCLDDSRSNPVNIPFRKFQNRSVTRSKLKRKRSPELSDDIDLDDPNSILTRINLKTIINRDTFRALPVDTQRSLSELLPLYDREKQQLPRFADFAAFSSDSEEPQTDDSPDAVWLHPSALSNEFFGKALQDYAERQARGDFAQRSYRSRSTRRASAIGRLKYRYRTSPDSTHSKLSKTSTPITSSRVKRASRISSRSNALRTALLSTHTTVRIRRRKLALPKPVEIRTTGVRVRTRASSSEDGNSRRTSARLMSQTLADSESRSIATPSERAAETTSTTKDSSIPKSSPINSINRIGDSPSSVCSKSSPDSSVSSRYSKENLPPKQPANTVHTKDTSKQKALSSPTGPTTDSQLFAPMPPPRQTKTLAAMREKMRAKRLMKEAERQRTPGSFYGSMTPHPASGSCGYYNQPPGYFPPGNLGSFPSPDLPKMSSSAFSSPRGPNSASPLSCDRPAAAAAVTKTTTSVQSSDFSFPKFSVHSPSSPHSLPVSATYSPHPHPDLDFLARILEQDKLEQSDEKCTKSYPSSPCSQNLVKPAVSRPTSGCHPNFPPEHNLGQSSSAPLTPSEHSAKLPVGVCPADVSVPRVLFPARLDLTAKSTEHTSTNMLPTSLSVSSPRSENSSETPLITSSCSAVSTNGSLPQLSIPINSNRLSTNTRAFFVDRDNLPQALALLQSLNPTATITQQQFLLIPGANKSQLFLCRAPTSEANPSVSNSVVTTASQNSGKQQHLSLLADSHPSEPPTNQNHSNAVTTMVSTATPSHANLPQHINGDSSSFPQVTPITSLVTTKPSLNPTFVSTSSSFNKQHPPRHGPVIIPPEQFNPKPIASAPRTVVQRPSSMYISPANQPPMSVSVLPSRAAEPPFVFFESPRHSMGGPQPSGLYGDLISVDPVYLHPNSSNHNHLVVPQRRTTIITSTNPLLPCIQASNMCMIPSVIPSPSMSTMPSTHATPQFMTAALQQPIIRYPERLPYSQFTTNSSLSPMLPMCSPATQTIHPKQQTCFILNPDHVTSAGHVPRPPL